MHYNGQDAPRAVIVRPRSNCGSRIGQGPSLELLSQGLSRPFSGAEIGGIGWKTDLAALGLVTASDVLTAPLAITSKAPRPRDSLTAR